MDVTIEPLTPERRDAWIAMRRALFADEDLALVEAECDQILREGRLKTQPFSCLLAIDRVGAPTGFIEISVRSSAEDCLTSPVGYVESWWVSASARGTGVGRALMEAAFAWARSMGCREMASDTRPTNGMSARAHAAMGFADVGVIRCFRREL